MFAQRLHQASILRGVILALDQGASRLDGERLVSDARRQYGVEVDIYYSASDFLRSAISWASDDVGALVQRFSARVVDRLQELEVSSVRVTEWAGIFAGPSSTER